MNIFRVISSNHKPATLRDKLSVIKNSIAAKHPKMQYNFIYRHSTYIDFVQHFRNFKDLKKNIFIFKCNSINLIKVEYSELGFMKPPTIRNKVKKDRIIKINIKKRANTNIPLKRKIIN